MRKSVLALTVAALFGVAGTASAGSLGVVGDNACTSYTTSTGVTVLFCDADFQPTGTGIFNPFLRTNPGGSPGAGNPSSGWNTDEIKQNWDQPNDADDSWTSALAASTLATVTIGSTQYKAFDVDINQQGTPTDPSSLLSLIHFQLYSCTSGSFYDALTAAEGCNSFFNIFGGTMSYGASGPGDPVVPSLSGSTDWVDFNYRLHTGSGSGDIRVFIPVSVFTGVTGYIALLDGWGTTASVGTYADNDGFQEWRALQGGNGGGGGGGIVVPEPASLLLFGTALTAFGVRLRSRRKPEEDIVG